MNLDCPKCAAPLVTMVRYDTEIEYCPGCRGVWLDRGELEKLMTREPVWRPDDDEDRRPPQARKKDGFLRRLFDFD
ncbi:TFIIB-type zinc ribbon-containing protein [Urbifossiella limnaea]|uniref:Transcription factor zinc-finger domain-containing protein n=1 Tax=Urbifossiella limnaea TaxID=2528023 RepID=A0A517XNX1_9BACT|nr:zf-TFIIB domain-containing protein [Urbifossiella limnaea]QDU19205.1 hypothetical protein ETAA1_11090 [Urbifossiella limnaea]